MPSPELGPDAILTRLEASGLRGRGGAWFPAARKWRAVRREDGDPVVVANGAEGEPGSVKDRFVLRTRADDVLSGLELAARAVSATEAIVYLEARFEAEEAALQQALDRAPSGRVVTRVFRGARGYVAGEETAVLASLEGRKAWPQPKPPLPAASGLNGRPTLVQNVETLMRVPSAVADPETYRRTETALVSLWGQVSRPGVCEVPLGTPLHRVIDEYGGGAPDGVGLIFPAGPSAAPLGGVDMDVPLDPDALREQGSGLGTAALLVVGSSACPICVAASLAAFFEREACGQCPPCVQGSASLARLVVAVEDGSARRRDLGRVREVASFMSGHGYCAHGRTGAAAITGLLSRFGDDVQAHLDARCCPRASGSCRPFDEGSPERSAIEAALFRQGTSR